MLRDLLGQTLGARYHFEQLLGEGTFAFVYRITDLHRQATLAAKVLRPEIARDPSVVKRFQQEAAVLAKLQHPHIVRYYGIVDLDGIIFILLDFIPGTTWENVLSQQNLPPKPHDSISILSPIAAALQFAHNEGIIHRDLKPANVLIHDNSTVLITDFGIARILNVTSELTIGATIGTPLYMAPEQITGQPVTPATDIYALGVILYRMCTGRAPFRGDGYSADHASTATRIIYEHVHVPPRRPSQLNPDLSLAVEEVILRCLNKEADKRFQSVTDFFDALTEAVGASPVALGPMPPHEPTAPRATEQPGRTLPEWRQFIHVEDNDDTSNGPPAPELAETVTSSVNAELTQPHIRLRADSESTIASLSPVNPGTHQAVLPDASVPAPAPPGYAGLLPASRGSPSWLTKAIIIMLLVIILSVSIAIAYLLTYEEQPFHPTSSIRATDSQALENTIPPLQVMGRQRITFDSRREGSLEIYTMNVDGSDLRRITSGTGVKRGPSWSPDGGKIAFYGASSEQANYDIFVMNADGSNVRNLTRSPDVDERYPTWSPDGARLAFHSNADGDFDITIINIDGSDMRSVTNNNAQDLGPDWSPDGYRIVFHTDIWGTPYELAVVDLQTQKITRLTQTDVINAFAAWSPDGSQLAYHVIVPGSNNVTINVMDANGSNPQSLTDPQARNAFPDWSPDGSYLIFQSGTESDSAIVRLSIESQSAQPVTGSDMDFLPDWAPMP